MKTYGFCNIIKFQFQKISNWWNQFWFQEGSSLNLGVLRFICFGFILFKVYGTTNELIQYAGLDDIFWHPKSFFQIFNKYPLDIKTTFLLIFLTKIFTIFALIGFKSRWTVPIAFLCITFFFGLLINFYKPRQVHACLVIVSGVLALSKSGHAFSWDAWWKRHFWMDARRIEYFVPIRFLQSYFALAYVMAAWAKMSESGLYWIFSDNLAFAVKLFSTPYGDFLVQNYGHWGSWIAFLVILVEMGWIFYFFRPYKKTVIFLIIPTMMMHLMSYIFMSIVFFVFILMHVVFVSWDRLIPKYLKQTEKKIVFKIKYKKALASTMIIFFLAIQMIEPLGKTQKPFNWPFVGYFMFAHPYLKSDGSYSKPVLKIIMRNGQERQIDKHKAVGLIAFRHKHFGEIVIKKYYHRKLGDFKKIQGNLYSL